MRRLRWQLITRMTGGQQLLGGFALVAILFMASIETSFEATDRLLSQGLAGINLFSREEGRQTSEPDQKLPASFVFVATERGLVRQEGSHETLEGLREIDTSKAYFEQFEHLGGTQWLPHVF